MKLVHEVTLEELRKLVALQAEDDMLWRQADTIDKAYIQQGLRYLTKAIEGELSFEETLGAIKEMMP